MAFTDVTDGSRIVLEGRAPVKITLAGTVKPGDPVGYNSGWVQADANGTYPAVLVAGEAGISGDVIVAYRAARLSGITTGTAGNKLFLSDTAGAYGASAGTMVQIVAIELGGGEIWAEPEEEASGLGDSVPLYFGDARDVSVKWDGSNFEFLPVADDTGTFAIGDGTTDMDFKWFGGTTGKTVLFDVGNARVDLTQVSFRIGTLSSTTPGSGFTLTDSVTRALEVHADDNDAARSTGTQGRAIFGRTMIYADNACEDWGVHGLSKISGVAKTGNVSAGVVGAFESTGTCSIATGQGNSYCAGVMGRVGGGGTFTITSSNVVGVLSFYNTTTANAFTNTGTCAFMAVASEIAGTGNWDYGLYIKDSVYGIECQAEPTATGRIAKFSGTIATPALTDGYGAFEVDVTFSGSPTDHSAASSSWVNITGGTTPAGTYICARNDGIYETSEATITNAKLIFGARMQYIASDTDALKFPFSLNTNNTAITALFDCQNRSDFGLVASAGTAENQLLPIMRDAAGNLRYVMLYTN